MPINMKPYGHRSVPRETLLKYPVTLTPDGRFFTVTFPDIPEAISQGDSVEDALFHAKDCLKTAMELYLEDGKPLPKPSLSENGQHTIEVRVRGITNGRPL